MQLRLFHCINEEFNLFKDKENNLTATEVNGLVSLLISPNFKKLTLIISKFSYFSY